jgi:hypothetical protein
MGSLLLAGPAMADVNVDIHYDKTKQINVREDIQIFKSIAIIVNVVSEPDRAAEAEALINQTNEYNTACENCAEKRDIITNSGNNNDGVVDTNQAAGNMNNQGNAVSISVDDSEVPPDVPGTSEKENDSYAQAQAAAEQTNWLNIQDATNLLEKSAEITDSFNLNNGVVHANQSAGNMNNQANALAMAVGFGEGGVTIAEADLGQLNTVQNVWESGAEKGDVDGFVNKFVTIDSSVNGNAGVVGVNQSAGNMANQANVVSFAVVIGQQAATP